jgi:cyclophilin family peptidyl-prolyl cis-trans isomerase
MQYPPAREPERIKELEFLKKILQFFEKNVIWVILIGAAIITVCVIIITSIHIRIKRVQTFISLIEGKDKLTVEELKKIKIDYSDLKEFKDYYDMYLYKLACGYRREGEFNLAKEKFEEFRKLYPTHHLIFDVEQALINLQEDIKWKEDEGVIDKVYELMFISSPANHEKLAEDDPRGSIIPYFRHTQVEIQTSKGNIVFDLMDDEAPVAVANFVELIEKGYLEKFDTHFKMRGNKVERITIKCETDVKNKPLPREDTPLKPTQQGVILFAYDEKLKGINDFEFHILLLGCPKLSGKSTVFGKVTSDTRKTLLDLKKDDPILGFTITKKRHTSYKYR